MYVLGINRSHHSSITLLKDNEVLLFLHEERSNRIKHYGGIPYNSLNYVKNYTDRIDAIVFQSGIVTNFQEVIAYLNNQGVAVQQYEVLKRKHHLTHAASAFYMSGFDEAHIIVIDGAGSIEILDKSKSDSTKIRVVSEVKSDYVGKFPNIDCIDKLFVYRNEEIANPIIIPTQAKNLCTKYEAKTVTISDKKHIGGKYSDVTRRLGFGDFNDGKTMGLSAYGSSPTANKHAKLAYDVQKELEDIFIEAVRNPMCNNIVLGGGCALNILGNSIIKKTYPHLDIFVDPIASDGTLSLGAAAHYFYDVTQCRDKLKFDAYRGPEYNLNYIYESVRKYSI